MNIVHLMFLQHSFGNPVWRLSCRMRMIAASSLQCALVLLTGTVEQDVSLLSAIIVPHCHYDVREAISADISDVHTTWHMLQIS